MSESDFWMTTKEAAKFSGFTTRHVQNLISAGKLSATRQGGKFLIEKSEFFRLFPGTFTDERGRNTSAEKELQSEVNLLSKDNEHLKKMNTEKDKEIEFLRNQLENTSRDKSKIIEVLAYQARAIEYKSNEK